MSDPTTAEIAATLKRLLKERGLTYEQLGARIGLSASGVKKTLSGRDCSVSRLQDICRVLEVHLDEVLREAREGKRAPFVFTDAQQQALCEQPELYDLLWVLSELDFDLDDVCARTGLPLHTARGYVLQLERLELLRTRPDGGLQGTWPPGSPWHMGPAFGAAVMSRLQRRFLEHAQRTFPHGDGLHDLQLGRLTMSRETATAFKTALRETVATYARQGDRETPFLARADRVQVGALTVLAPLSVVDLVSM
jgi:transcriptional regulator with XRE-family HTH domain